MLFPQAHCFCAIVKGIIGDACAVLEDLALIVAFERSSKRSNVKTHKNVHGDGSMTAAVVEPNCFLG